ncbi:hypothetical protein [Clostridium estertheticum]|uniref:hypothetical protein n=1 Tax=Clostridium estertheticum TaxID=238834 RepID=UPI001C0BAD9D|nr:hypothetical protein [Clostridium estertheticum]MBU3071936.1 hypothetical protein [Clostridium estertheticum]MBU3162028.1 hypothetical protein [Clostridium estertheticum]
MGDRILKINSNSMFRIKIEKVYEFEESYFREEYLKSAKALNDIIELSTEDNERDNNRDEYNNIIAFLGERGTGKTSVMVSFKNSLMDAYKTSNTNRDEEIIQSFNDCDFDLIYKKIHKKKYKFLDIVDPSVFSNKDSIVEIVVAEMFKIFKNFNGSDNYLEKQELAKNFESVYKDLRIINKERHSAFDENFDSLEVLIDLSSAISLKNNLTKLLENYLNYINLDKIDSDYLVIAIDDLDMNISAGENMLEDIRKYLIVPKVIILMAAKIEQLEDVVKQKNIIDLRELSNYYKDVDVVNRQSKLTVAFNKELNNKTQKYLEKIIPFSRRVYMSPISLSSVKLEVDLPGFKCKGKTLGKEIAKQFKDRLGYIIISEEHWRAIIPNNLRGFVGLVVTISNLNKNMTTESKKENLKEIREYFNKCIIETIEDSEKKDFLDEILYCYFKSINKKILIHLNNIVYEKSNAENNVELEKEIPIFKYIKEIKENEVLISEDNVSMGYIICCIKIYEKYMSSEEEKRFIEILKGVYTIRLLHGYYYQPENLLSVTGKDFIGRYLECTGNKHYDKFEYVYRSTKKSITDLRFTKPEYKELDPNIYKNISLIDEKIGIYKFESTVIVKKEDKSKLDEKGKKQFEEINSQLTAYYNMLEIRYTEEKKRSDSRLYRRELVYSNSWNEKAAVNYYKFKPLNIIGEKLYKHHDKKQNKYEIINEIENSTGVDNNLFEVYKKEIDCRILYILNIDYFMKLLKYFDFRLHNKRFSKNVRPIEILIYSISSINEVFSKMNTSYEFDEHQCIIDELEPLQYNFIENNLNITWDGDEEKLISDLESNLNILKSYLILKKSGEGLTRFNNEVIKKLKPIEELVDKLNLEKESFEKLKAKLQYIISVKNKKEDDSLEKERKIKAIGDAIKEVEVFNIYIAALTKKEGE